MEKSEHFTQNRVRIVCSSKPHLGLCARLPTILSSIYGKISVCNRAFSETKLALDYFDKKV